MTPIELSLRPQRRALATGILYIGIAQLCHLPAAWAADDVPPRQPSGVEAPGKSPVEEQEVEAIVVTAGRVNAATAVAPARGVLTETEPEAVITRKFIEESAPRVGDFSTIAVFGPSTVATPQPNGPGLSDGGKISLRGFSDGNYNITYDDIAWGDTNGPSHHGTAFFPSSTIGGIIIDRGPGRAEDFGPANFGGSVNLKSLPLEDVASISQVITGGSFGTRQFVTTGQSGKIEALHGAQFLANFQELYSDGYLSNNGTNGNVQMVKAAVPLTDGLTLTALATHTAYFYNKSDIGDALISDLEKYGQNFSLSNDPTQQNYYKYNWATKDTHFEYIRIAGDLSERWGLTEILYNFGYDNNTSSGASQVTGAADVVTPDPGPTYPKPGKTYAQTDPALQVSGIPGYRKKNQYQITGDILKLAYTVPFGTLTFGSNFENSESYRFIVDVNLLNGEPDYREKAATLPGPSAPYTQIPLNLEYIEFSGWNQYQPFAEFDWRPTDRLTITPGVKYVHWDLHLDAPEEKLSNGSQPLTFDEVFTKTIPFFTANYRLRDDWSVYLEYAQGLLIPNIGNFYVGNLSSSKVVPQTSTNYQLGTVFNLERFTFDGDIYWIDFQHKIQQYVDANNQPYETNSGGATYKGVELQGTYAFKYGISAFANGSYNQARGKDDPSNPLYNGHQLTGAALWTAALGLRFEQGNLFANGDSAVLAIDDKFIGEQFVNNASCSTVNSSGICVIGPTTVLTPVLGRIPSYSQADVSLSYRIANYVVEAQVLNVLNHHSLTSMKGKAYLPGSDEFALTTAAGGGSNAPEFQVPISAQFTVKAKF